MSAVKKRQRPANDQRPRSSQRMSYVALPRSYWSVEKIAVAAVLGFFLIILCLVAAEFLKEKTSVAAANSKRAAPFDIRLDASALAPPDVAKQIAAALPPHVTITKPSLRQHALPPVMEITVSDDVAVPEDSAEDEASLAQKAAQRGDYAQALQLQHRAVEIAPANKLYRLGLAILHDQSGDKDGAVVLYRQVIQAYEKHDASLPASLAIDGIRRRLKYLTSTAR